MAKVISAIPMLAASAPVIPVEPSNDGGCLVNDYWCPGEDGFCAFNDYGCGGEPPAEPSEPAVPVNV